MATTLSTLAERWRRRGDHLRAGRRSHGVSRSARINWLFSGSPVHRWV